MLEIRVDREEFLRQISESDRWRPAYTSKGDPAAHIAKDGTKVIIAIVDDWPLSSAQQLDFIDRLELLCRSPRIDAKREK